MGQKPASSRRWSEETRTAWLSIISLFAKKKIVHCGLISSGHAVKAVNNCLNAAHLIVGGEALIALAKWGVRPEIALNAINAHCDR